MLMGETGIISQGEMGPVNTSTCLLVVDYFKPALSLELAVLKGGVRHEELHAPSPAPGGRRFSSPSPSPLQSTAGPPVLKRTNNT